MRDLLPGLEHKVQEVVSSRAKPAKGEIKMGEFGRQAILQKNRLLLWVGETSYRCGSVQGLLGYKEAEGLLGHFIEGKFTYDPGSRINDKLDQVDWEKPNRINKRGDAISVGFPHKGGTGWVSSTCRWNSLAEAQHQANVSGDPLIPVAPRSHENCSKIWSRNLSHWPAASTTLDLSAAVAPHLQEEMMMEEATAVEGQVIALSSKLKIKGQSEVCSSPATESSRSP